MTPERETAVGVLYEYGAALIEEKRTNPASDMLSTVVHAELSDADPPRLSDEELSGFFSLVFSAGAETTRNAVAGAMLAFLEWPDQLDLLRSGRAAMDGAVEEILRWTTPSPSKRRTATVPCELGGARIAPGDKVVVWEGSANRDPGRFDAPDAFLLQRDPNPHLRRPCNGRAAIATPVSATSRCDCTRRPQHLRPPPACDVVARENHCIPPLKSDRSGKELGFSRQCKSLACSIVAIDGCRLTTSGGASTMQLHKTMRLAGVSLSAAALALITAEGPAAAHEGSSSPDLRGRVTSVASGEFVIQKYDGTTETVDSTGGTTYSEPGSSVALPGVVSGENVAVSLDPSATSPTATNVVVLPERASGRVTNVAGSTVTLSNRHGTHTVLVSSDTKYYEKGTSPAGVSDGEQIVAFGLPDTSTPGALDAQVVAIFGPQPQLPPPTTAAVTPGAQPGGPHPQPDVPQIPSAPNTTSWNHPAPSGAPFTHGPSGGQGNWGGPGPRGATRGGGFGSPGFGHR
jgi:hypothetical protein